MEGCPPGHRSALGEEMARVEVAAMVVAEVAMTGIKVVFFHTAHRPDVPQHG